MIKQFLKAGLLNQCKREFLSRQTNLYRINCKSIRNASSKNHDDDDDMDRPIKYSASPAASWRAEKSRNPLIDRHPYESTVITVSLLVLLLYFLVFREENDIDLQLNADLLENYPGLNIEQSKYYNK